MATARIDRRVARTRASLHHALMTLIVKKGYEAVSVEDICVEADVGRSTFYAHYAGKDELKRSGLEHFRKALLEEHRSALAEPNDASRRQLAFSLMMFEHASSHIDRYRAMVGHGDADIMKTIRDTVAEMVRNELTLDAKRSKPVHPREIAVRYLVGAFMAVLSWWLEDGAKIPPSEIDVMFKRLTSMDLMVTTGSP